MTAEPFDLLSHVRRFAEVLEAVHASTRQVDPVGSADLNCALLAVMIQDALALGVRHFDRSGRPLATGAEVAEAILADGGVAILGPAEARRRRPNP
jgi:hypothetical protein